MSLCFCPNNINSYISKFNQTYTNIDVINVIDMIN